MDPSATTEEPTSRDRTRGVHGAVLTGTGLQIFARLWSSAASMGVWWILGRTLSEHAQGIYTHYFTMFVVAATVLDFGAFAIAVREISREPEREGEILRVAMVLRLIGAALCSTAIALFAWLQESAELQRAILGLAILHLFAQCPATLGVHFQARIRFAALSLPLIAGSSVFFSQAFFLQRGGCAEPEPYLVAYGAGIVVQSLLTFLWGIRRVDWLGPIDRRRLRAQFREMLPLGVSATAAALYFQLDLLLLRNLAPDEVSGSEALASYNHAFRLLNFAVMVPATFGQALFPILSRVARGDPARVVRVTSRATFYLAAVMLPAAAMTPKLGPGVLRILFPHASTEADRCLQLLAIGAIAIFLTYPQITALTAIGRQADYTRIALCVLPLKLGALGLGYQMWGLPGVAAANLTAEWVVFALVSARLARHLRGWVIRPVLMRPVFAGAVVALVASFLPDLRGISSLTVALALESGGLLLAGVLPFRLDTEPLEGAR